MANGHLQVRLKSLFLSLSLSLSLWPPAREVAQLGVESVHGSESSQGVPHVPVGRDVVASQGRLTHLADNILP